MCVCVRVCVCLCEGVQVCVRVYVRVCGGVWGVCEGMRCVWVCLKVCSCV